MSVGSYELGDVSLQYGGILPSAFIGFETHGKLNAARDNAILFPTWCAGNHEAARYIIGEGRPLDPTRYFIVVVDIFGNGMSSSPSNMPAPSERMRFPHVSLLDNVSFQRRLLHEHFGIERLRLIVGRSMGAQIAFQWGAYYADEMDGILALAGSARTSPHNYVYLAALKLALTSPCEWQGGDYETNPVESLRRMRLTTDAWGFSQSFYRAGLHLAEGHDSTQAYLDRADPYAFGDVNDVLAQIRTWESADISDNPRFAKDFHAALRAITARTIIMPSQTDMYFPPDDSVIEQAHMPNAELRVLPSIWGHRGASPGSDPRDIAFFETAIADLLKA
ncbi:alpha/beta fold hydrolase [Sphingobium sp. H39-3-25]|uniref:alpha/beta fold hydrolase n=1 Tax=Sphingobium arseniciresistens TaxID=3030834 RepID=UPI0023BA1514|nr:alpha/beta fold hydrolase [Sphingobium arseniciresistens]